MADIRLKRAYDEVSEDDGTRILVDRLWPRGVSKKDAKLDDWLKEIAPSNELRKWYGHDPEQFDEFVHRYHKELEEKTGALKELEEYYKSNNRLTFIYSAKDRRHNNAVALRNYILERVDPDQ